jgi:predicted AlkP superfamily phosphohydrolase/phosphomutase
MAGRAVPSVIAVCVEVASPERMTDWIAQGWLPNLGRMREQGAWLTLESVTELSSGSIWPSFYTGVHPGKHGQFFTHMQIEPGTYRIVKKYANDVPRDPFWAELHKAGVASTVIDVAQSQPLPGFNGVHVAGWGSEFPAWPRSSQPKTLISEIVRRFGSHPLTDEYRLALRPETATEHESLSRDLLHGARTKAQLSSWLLREYPAEFFLTVFPEPHWATHLLWDTIDPGHPRHNATLADARSATFRAVLATIDAFIGEARAAHPDANVLVFSLSGMGPNYSGWHILPELLRRLGLSGEPRGIERWMPMARWGAWTTRAAERLTGRPLLEFARRALPRKLWDSWTRRMLHAGGAWPDSRVFWVPNDYTGALRVNLEGREPHGRVKPGAEYDAICSELTAALHELRHPETGRPLVRDVLRPQRQWPGPYAAVLPDLLVLWASETPIHGARSERVGTIRCEYPERRTGAHRRDAFLAAAGPRIARNSREGRASILDLAPTFLHLAGVAVPDDYDGRVLEELFEPGGRARSAPQCSAQAIASPR